MELISSLVYSVEQYNLSALNSCQIDMFGSEIS